MALTKQTFIERILIVLNSDGSFKGAHQESLTLIEDDNTVMSSVQEPAVGLTASALLQVLPNQAALLAQLDELTKERDALLAKV